MNDYLEDDETGATQPLATGDEPISEFAYPSKLSTSHWEPLIIPLTEDRIRQIFREEAQKLLYPPVSELLTDASQYRRVVLHEEDGTAWQGMLYLKSKE